MCAAHDKLLMNIALGFDTFLVMRHGTGPVGGVPAAIAAATAAENEGEGNGEAETVAGASVNTAVPVPVPVPVPVRAGCYFCNDVVAATNSTRDRTLDQQCTVTRPGISYISAALGVELMVALLQPRTGAGEEVEEEGKSGGTGGGTSVPHQIRGSVATFTQFTPQVCFAL
jgi:ubiquitin-like modifier-activating enzyme ATG7